MLTRIALSLFVGILSIPFSGTLQAQQEAKESTVTTEYLLALPDGYDDDPDKEWPLIIFLHGAGERGDDLNKVKVHGPPKLIEAGQDMPFIVVSPQCPANKWWSPVLLNSMLDQVIEENRVDEDRVYLTGLSMGGFGTWTWASENPERFAAIAPICGAGDDDLAWRLRHIPTWVFHGAKDNVVPISGSEEMVEGLKEYSDDVQFTVYPEANHDSWTVTYDNPMLYEWFLEQKRTYPAEVSLNASELTSYIGTYDIEGRGEVKFVDKDGKLAVVFGDNQVPLEYEGNGRFHFAQNPNSLLAFEKDDGVVDEVMMYNERGNTEGKKVTP